MNKWALSACVAWAAVSASAAPHTFNNGPGDGTVTLGSDGYGAFGSSVGVNASNAIYDPVGAGTPAGTSFESGVAIRFGSSGTRQFLTSGSIGTSPALPTNPTITGGLTFGSSAFSFGGLSFALSQTLVPLYDGFFSQIGSRLDQVFMISNPGGATASFELLRYLDGDLQFNSSIADGGGRGFFGGTETLFETDSATGAADATTLVGITAEGGTTPGTGRYQISSFSGLLAAIIAGTALTDTVVGDGGDSDQFIDAGGGYDVTLALRNTFDIGPGGTASYTTRTIFGSGSPESLPPPPSEVPEPGTCIVAAGLVVLAGGTRWLRRNRS